MSNCGGCDRRELGRRELLRYGLAGAGWFALSPARSALAAASAARSGDYKALVCLFLSGGNDAFNLVVPSSGDAYATYHASRGSLAVPSASLLPIAPLRPGGISWGVHPSAPAIASLFQSGKLAVVSNVGSLIEPVTRAQYRSGSAVLPPQLFSHADQTQQWMSARSDDLAGVGWCGRIAERIGGGTVLPMNISVAGSNTLQTGLATAPYDVKASGIEALTGFLGQQGGKRFTAFQALLDKPKVHEFERAYAATQEEALELEAFVASALEGAPAFATAFPEDSAIARQLGMVARLIAVRGALGVARQIFYVDLGGFDTHQGQAIRQPRLFAELAAALAAFQAAMEQLGVAQEVTTFTASEFGRTLSSNGEGSDHGWGSHQLVMGGAVLGQDFYGAMPSLALDGPDDSGNGRIIPTQSVEQYCATLARWFGVGSADLAAIFPSLGNFASSDLGFLA